LFQGLLHHNLQVHDVKKSRSRPSRSWHSKSPSGSNSYWRSWRWTHKWWIHSSF
jgi:hypothetical protein